MTKRLGFSLKLALFALLSTTIVGADAVYAAPTQQARAERPRLGLVLSGGGARGFAHIGALKALEELRVRFDVITGTSMGSMVGGAYAAGYSAKQIEDITLAVDWPRMFAPRPDRNRMDWQGKDNDRRGLGPTEIGVTKDGLRFSGQLVPSQELDIFLQRSTQPFNSVYDLSELEKVWFEGIEYLRQFKLVDSEHEINFLLASGKSVLCEGAQGTMLDVDFGSYPFVTSSNTICAGACTGLGVAPNKIGDVYGIFKAYCTRVGAGPFPTELFDETGDKIGALGHEFGAVTGRKRRCGWIDLVALKYAVMIDGVTKLIMMKSDVLDSFETIKACVAYKVDGEEIDYFPFDIKEGNLEPVYVELPGWKTDMTKMQSEDEFPEEFNAYLSFLEEQLGVPIKIVSVGPDREQTIERYLEDD